MRGRSTLAGGMSTGRASLASRRSRGLGIAGDYSPVTPQAKPNPSRCPRGRTCSGGGSRYHIEAPMHFLRVITLVGMVSLPACAAAAKEPDPADLVREVRQAESWTD